MSAIRFLKRIRDDYLLWRYVRQVPGPLQEFLKDHRDLGGHHLAIVIAFEQPWIIEILIRQFKEHVTGFELMIFDNSRSAESRTEITRICGRYSVPLFGLPENSVRHPNRSHGMAMTWIYHNVIKNLEPDWFGYLDHDLIPIKPVDYRKILVGQNCFGRANQGAKGYWSLWAGYCFFRYSYVSGYRLNFLNDFSRDLDTGGRNWGSIYSRLPLETMTPVPTEKVLAEITGLDDFSMSLLDSRWLHVGGVGHRSVDTRKVFYRAFTEAFLSGNFDSDRFRLKRADGQKIIL